ncbi:MAG: polyphenol oxidase family protein [Raoultibacter sp.]
MTALTDEALFAQVGVRIAFTQRSGGVSCGAYDSLNLGAHVEDVPASVQENRRRVQVAFGAEGLPCIIPQQVHGMCVLDLLQPDAAPRVQAAADQGADGIVVGCTQAAALLCFADCVPLIIVSPTGHFAVVHAGWRGVEGEIAAVAVRRLAALDAEALGVQDARGARDARGAQDVSSAQDAQLAQVASAFNVYIGPYIHAECFETSPEIHERFTNKFGRECAFDAQHIDLGCALRVSLQASGIQEARIADAATCTVCGFPRYFSYRAAHGVCGRHAAFAVCLRRAK